MASVDWMKIKAGGMRGLAAHYQQDLREKLNHSNQQINKDMTKYNFSIGADDFYEACDKVKNRVKEVDEKYPPKRVKKDRVTACSLEVVCPPEIEAMGMVEVSDFFRKSYAELENYFGKENVGGGFVHFDEKHEYIDAATKQKRESLFHMNFFVAAYVDEDVSTPKTKKHDARVEHLTGINGKHFCSRKHMKEVNKIMEDICHEYGIEWHTGAGKNFETVETLKAKSAKAAVELEEERLAVLASQPAIKLDIETVKVREKVGIMKTEEKTVQALVEPYRARELTDQVKAVQMENERLQGLVEVKDKELQEANGIISNFQIMVLDLLEALYNKTVKIDKSWFKRWAEKLPFLDKEMSGYENHKKSVWKPDLWKRPMLSRDKEDPTR